MAPSKMISTNVKLPDHIMESLDREAQMQGIPSSELMGRILARYSEWEKFSREIGFASVTRAFLRSVLDQVDSKTISTIAVTTCRGAFRDAMLYVTGSTGREGFEKTIEYWLETTNISYKKLEKDGNDYYILQHFLGYKWSLYFSTLVGSILTEMGYHTRDLHLGNDSVSFYISGQEPRKEAVGDAS